MALKFIFRFNWYGSRGWSETFYSGDSGGPNSAVAEAKARGFARMRTGCLAAGSTLLGVSIADPIDPRNSKTIALNLPGVLGGGILQTPSPDVANIAILNNLQSASGTRRSYLQRGLDDGDVVNGVVTYARNGAGSFNAFWQYISTNDSFALRNTTPGTPIEIDNVNGDGLMTTTTDHGLSVGDRVLVKTQTIGNGPKIRWYGVVRLVPLATAAYLKGWKRGEAEGGEVQDVTITYESITSFATATPNLARTRQTGHPFGLVAGRQRKRY